VFNVYWFQIAFLELEVTTPPKKGKKGYYCMSFRFVHVILIMIVGSKKKKLMTEPGTKLKIIIIVTFI